MVLWHRDNTGKRHNMQEEDKTSAKAIRSERSEILNHGFRPADTLQFISKRKVHMLTQINIR